MAKLDDNIDPIPLEETSNDQLFEAAISSLNAHDHDPRWYLNSGAIQHVSRGRYNFNSLGGFSGNVKTTEGHSHQIAGCGIVHLKFPLGEIKEVSDILYVHGLQKNLLSIGYFTNRGLIACFSN